MADAPVKARQLAQGRVGSAAAVEQQAVSFIDDLPERPKLPLSAWSEPTPTTVRWS